MVGDGNARRRRVLKRAASEDRATWPVTMPTATRDGVPPSLYRVKQALSRCDRRGKQIPVTGAMTGRRGMGFCLHCIAEPAPLRCGFARALGLIGSPHLGDHLAVSRIWSGAYTLGYGEQAPAERPYKPSYGSLLFVSGHRAEHPGDALEGDRLAFVPPFTF
jgi:hypothetical protein